MAYTYREAIKTAYKYLSLNEDKTEIIEETADRGLICDINGAKKVIFVYPISCKQNNTQNFFDTRDSGSKERRITWQYAKKNNLPYFCLGFNEEQERYEDYVLSLESDELDISQVSYRKSEESESTGTQVNIPNDFIPNKKFERRLTPKGFFIAAIHKDYVNDYLSLFDNRPYLDGKRNIEDNNDCIDFNDINNSIKEEFRQYLVKARGLKNTNQVNALDSLSELMLKNQIITDSIYSIYDVKEYGDVLEKIEDSNVYKDYKKEKKEKNPRSGLASEQGLHNYLKFLEYRDNMEQFQKVNFKTGYETSFARNRILFGAPGTGKSFKLNKERIDLLKDDVDKNYERVTFHPDYSYANFVGTYKPIPTKDDEGKDSITYEYVPGPFMRVYVNALKSGKTANPKPYLLIIEEINRANVAAVFGDVFQLLDRVNNVSEYPIMPSQDMKEYLAKPEVLGGSPDDYSIIKIPDNMFIWATMNSADQGVFPMDTAFKRRWEFSYIGIDDAVSDMKDTIKNKEYTFGKGANERIVKWNDLRSAINDVLSSESYNINEDKLLGPYFISKSVLENEDEKEFLKAFKNKVLMYLFEDAVKQKRKIFFERCKAEDKGVRYSDLCNQFDTKGVLIFPEEVSSKFIGKPTTEKVVEENEE